MSSDGQAINMDTYLANGNSNVTGAAPPRSGGPARIQTKKAAKSAGMSMKAENNICHDDSGPTVKAQTIDELRSLQKKRSAPSTPINLDGNAQFPTAFSTVSEEDRQRLQLRSIRDKRVVKDETTADELWWGKCIRATPEELESFGHPDFTIYNAGQFPCNRYTHYMTSSTSIDINLDRREMVILGTQYAGEMKKGLFSVMHYLMPMRGILSLHSGCNMGKDGDVALFFGLSGTGKTTLSTDHNRLLIGDDEHCWSDNGVSNIEGGCYAKCIDLSSEKEPDIFNAIKFGTENTRASYPIEYIPNAKIPCVGPHPKNVILLACDAFGVLPPVSKLSLAQTMYHFITGYTALVAGTEDGIKEPQATFSACFGAAFIMLHPTKYAAMLADRMQKYGATAWLVNTGWCGGRYGVGSRIKLAYTRSIINAIHSGELLNAEYIKTDVFGLEIPTAVAGLPSEILNPVNAWENKKLYKETLLKLAGLFKQNFEVYSKYKIGSDSKLTDEILAAGPNF
ncbi:Phosphoenolpyruvate carboxykinase [ATP] [Platanthera guangdongensis]|uniref:phosphoenolpyruvate carboxykinase (ATP) n=1 Tax=Platanthera guangdongensis TaxID=2320717 RepID=A0ABR2MU85_9ASPA